MISRSFVSIGRSLVCAATLALTSLSGARAFGAEPPCPSPAPAPPPAPGGTPPAAMPETPGFGSRVVAASDVIVVGTARLVGRATIKGTTVARVEVERVLKGTAASSLTVFVPGPRNTDDPKAPSAPYIDEKVHRAVLFLRATPNGSGLALDTLFLAEDHEGREKLEVLEQELAIAATADPLERGRKSAAYLLGLVGGERPWSRTHAVRELEVLSRAAPAAFDDATLARLDSAKRGIPGRSERAVLAATLDRLDPDTTRRERGARAALAPPATGAGEPSPDAPSDARSTPRYRRAKSMHDAATEDGARATALAGLASAGGGDAAPDLLDAFRAGGPLERERAAVLVADLGVESAWPTLRRAYEGEPEAAVREAVVRAAGYLGAEADVDWLVKSASGDGLRRARCFAFARIRTPDALAALRREADAAHAATPPDETVGTLADYLIGPAFEKTDPALKLRARRTKGTEAPAGGTPARPAR